MATILRPPPVTPIAITDPNDFFTGEGSVTDFLYIITTKATQMIWNDAQKRTAAISALKPNSTAHEWHLRAGGDYPDWVPWQAALKAAFAVTMTNHQWEVMVEERVQHLGESGSIYAIDKMKMQRKRTVPLTDAEMMPFLIRGLNNPIHETAMCIHNPQTLNAFILEITRLKGISNKVNQGVGLSKSSGFSRGTGGTARVSFVDHPKDNLALDGLARAQGVLVRDQKLLQSQIKTLARLVNRESGYLPRVENEATYTRNEGTDRNHLPAGAPITPRTHETLERVDNTTSTATNETRTRGNSDWRHRSQSPPGNQYNDGRSQPRERNQYRDNRSSQEGGSGRTGSPTGACYHCNQVGHIARDCPVKTAELAQRQALRQPPGNGMAGPHGQGQPKREGP